MTKQKILRSAINIMKSNSFSNTTARMIASDAKISVGTIYNHYSSKEDILNYLFEQEYHKRQQYLLSLKKSEKSNIDKLLSFVEFHFLELKANKGLAKVLIRESSNPDLTNLDGIKKFNKELPVEFADIIKQAVLKNEIRACSPSLVSNIIFNLIRGAVFSAALEESIDMESMKSEVKIFIKNGLRKQSGNM
ncbi:MAG: TetR/AcrR family transcriptional regulator [Clostridia bacterium]